MNKQVELNKDWKMTFLHHSEYLLLNQEIINSDMLRDLDVKFYSAKVPGNFILDLYDTGEISDPYFGDNIIKLQNYEDAHVFYSCKFDYQVNSGFEPYIHFEGIDVFSEIYINGNRMLKTDNMFIPWDLDGKYLKPGVNELFIHIYPTIIEAEKESFSPGEIAMSYNYPSLHVRKAAHMFGWDITPRMVHAGIWRSVFLVYKPKSHICDTYLYTVSIDSDHSGSDICLYYSLDIEDGLLNDYEIICTGICGDSSFEAKTKIWFNSGRLPMHVKNAKLWWTKDRGDPNLYDVTVTLVKTAEKIDQKQFSFGIKTFELYRDNGRFEFKLNHEKLFIKGTNWVPADAFHSRDASRIPQILDLIDDIGCNAIRCWGGNIYESEQFFDICDRKGFIVWQDFAMACGTYPQNEKMQQMIRREAEVIVKKLRQHPSLCIWAGDNECDMAYLAHFNRNPNDNVLTRKIIPEVLYSYDPARPFIPSSPYVDQTTYENGSELPEDHLWGPRDYYKGDYYKHNRAVFASEIGYHGCPSPESVKKFIPAESVFPYMNDDWIVHAASPEKGLKGDFSYRIELMANQIKVLFGSAPDNIYNYSLASQISQAEAMKFFIELFRIQKWQKTGIIWWNIMDAWPQFSDAVVDYYFTKKLAYQFIKNVQTPVCMMLDAADGVLKLYGSNDTKDTADVAYEVFVVQEHSMEKLIADQCTLKPDSTESICGMDINPEQNLYLIKWKLKDGSTFANHYLAGNPPFNFNNLVNKYKYAGLLKVYGFGLEEKEPSVLVEERAFLSSVSLSGVRPAL